jgi:hypothetical protein
MGGEVVVVSPKRQVRALRLLLVHLYITTTLFAAAPALHYTGNQPACRQGTS